MIGGMLYGPRAIEDEEFVSLIAWRYSSQCNVDHVLDSFRNNSNVGVRRIRLSEGHAFRQPFSKLGRISLIHHTGMNLFGAFMMFDRGVPFSAMFL